MRRRPAPRPAPPGRRRAAAAAPAADAARSSSAARPSWLDGWAGVQPSSRSAFAEETRIDVPVIVCAYDIGLITQRGTVIGAGRPNRAATARTWAAKPSGVRSAML
ncbi:hypothetical protein [Streptomyces siamensis]|uniref:Uncharacterized protein n=1 Tax=Streptomyces siamensis TaxID=1274986 RepID=A0ABP9JQC0_9ACTN